MSDDTRRRGPAADLSRQARVLPLDALRVLDRIASRLARRQQRDLMLTLETMRTWTRDQWGRDLDDDSSVALDDAIAQVADLIAAEDQAHERARDEVAPRPPTEIEQAMADAVSARDRLLDHELAAVHLDRAGNAVTIGLPGDDMSDMIAVPVDSDQPAATYRPAIRLVVDEPVEVDERDGGG